MHFSFFIISTLFLFGLIGPKTPVLAMNEPLSLQKEPSSLHEAIKNNNLEEIKAICEAHPLAISTSNAEGYSPLYSAVSQGLSDAVALILSYDPIISQEGPLRKTALHEAARKGDNLIVPMLIKKMNSESVNLLSGEAISALCYACYNGHSKTAEILIDAGAKIKLEFGDKEWSPLHIATFHGHRDTVEIICKRLPQAIHLLTPKNLSAISIALGLSDINKAKTLLNILIEYGSEESLFSEEKTIKNLQKFLEKDASLWTPYGEYALKEAIIKQDMQVIKILIEDALNRQIELDNEIVELASIYDIDMQNILSEAFAKICYGVDISPESSNIKLAKKLLLLIMEAEKGDSDQFIKQLINQGIDINEKTNEGLGILNFAVDKIDTSSTIKFLVNHGAKVNPKDFKAIPPLFTAIMLDQMIAINSLIDCGADIHHITPHGWSYLMLAAQKGQIEIMELLIKKGINVNITTLEHFSALCFATEHGNPEYIRFLIKNGAKVNPKEFFAVPPLLVAIKKNQKEAVKTLIDCGADIEKKTSAGSTFLMIATDFGHTEMVELLLEKGADIKKKNTAGQTALSLAKEKKHKDILKILKAHLKKKP
jgi:serine/threonine-protein phosphatase 6 regulatory ankyrin repeat subunit B